MPQLGLQNDEALFGNAIYPPHGLAYSLKIAGAEIPLMLMSYLGTLKGWIYAALFQFVTPSVYSIRIPVLLAGALSIWLFFILMRRLAGSTAAVIGAALLATEPIYLLTTVFDWGPVALQHLLLLGGLVLLTGEGVAVARWLGIGTGFFLFGLALWDKALFSWLFVGMALGALAACPRELWRTLSPWRAMAAATGFCLGALPLFIYNINNNYLTFTGNASYVPQDIPPKFGFLIGSLRGLGLLGWMTPPAENPYSTLLLPALVLALLAAPLLTRREIRVIVFALVTIVVAWLQMAVTRNAGGSIHHTVLLWPFPQMIVAVAGAHWRRLGAAAACLVVASNLLLLNQYHRQISRNGGGLNWTDAIFPLARYMKTVPAQWVLPIDWGILDSLRLLDAGRLPMAVGSEPLMAQPPDRKRLKQWMESPGYVFVAHTEGNEFFQGVRARLLGIASELGFRREMLAVIPDRRGRPIFEVFSFRPSAKLEDAKH